MPKILITSIGSLGDLNPFIGIASEMQRRGYTIAFATTEYYREKILGYGFEFYPVGPRDLQPNDPEIIKLSFDPYKGFEKIHRQLIFPHLTQSYADLQIATEGVVGIISGSLSYNIPLIAYEKGIKWASATLQPSIFLSKYDPLILPQAMFLKRFLNPSLNGFLIKQLKKVARRWQRDLDLLRTAKRVPGDHPFFLDSIVSPELNLSLFSSAFAQPRPDWPASNKMCGFIFHDKNSAQQKANADALEFINRGDPPLVITAGTAAIVIAEKILEEAMQMAELLNKRCLILAGSHSESLRAKKQRNHEKCFITDYCPHSEVFPKACLILHQAGMGTLAQVLRSGRPSLCIPFGMDQFDNSVRLAALGCAEFIPSYQFTARHGAKAVRSILNNPTYSENALKKQSHIETNGTETACEALVSFFEAGLNPKL